ncbi:MAG: ribosome-associated translation inhibitor RaiA [Leptolyngbya sp. PLA1]|nr:ribosome-associated translation inhibitor RaiA [Leptolyngbya sp. PLA1]
MRVEVIGKNFEISEPIRDYAVNKANKLTKYFDGLQLVTVRIMKVNHKANAEYEAEIILDVEKHDDFVSHATGQDAYAAIDLVMEKGERQLRDFKEQLKKQ